MQLASIADVLGRTGGHVKMIGLGQMPVWVVLFVVIALVAAWIMVDRRRHYGRGR